MRIWILFLAILLVAVQAWGQEEKESKTKKLWRGMMNDLTAAQNDTVVNIKSENAFLPFHGKTIRNIQIDRVGFEKPLYDSMKKTNKAVVNVANALHTDTRPKIIRQNLFIKEGTPLNAYKLADNERYLRDLEFIVDARIRVVPIDDSDSVDLVIVTRDNFSIGFSGYPSDINKGKFRVYDANFLGMGQRIQFGGEWDGDLDPSYGNEFLYTKTSFAGSLIDLSLLYTEVNTGISLGSETETAFAIRMNRSLLSPYMRMAGGYEWSTNWSENVKSKPDTIFRKYQYILSDFWIGYNIGIKKAQGNRSRHFASFRWYNQKFEKQPTQIVEWDNPIYNDNISVLGQFTFYNKDFYRTRYVYGFGVTEDVQYGTEVSLIAGIIQRLNLQRPYLGVKTEKIFANDKGDLIGLSLNASTFIKDGEMRDAAYVANVRFFTRLYSMKRVKIREFINISYTQQYFSSISDPLKLRGKYGLTDFKSSIEGTKRYGIQSQTVFFTNWQLLGFRFAGVAYLEMASLGNNQNSILTSTRYYSIGAGIRTRNENLSFGTMEAKFQFYPRTPEGVDSFRLTFSTNLRVRSSGILVDPPSIVNYNQ